ncbi:DUF192 domain-containing protein [Rhizobium sp. 0TCS1.26]|uniref:DUF192 domain-containing protein n=1 Tax=Rhizobium sp. 0TCS1.26 TaxID=3142623 RepID=UPI003D2916FA
MRGALNNLSQGVRLICAVISVLAVCMSMAAAQVRFDKQPLTIETRAGARHQLTVELAVDPQQREQGLMYRKQMPTDHGMLFDFDEARPVSMWMRNTLIPLDMLFLDDKGVVTHLHEGAVPLSEAIISSGGPVRYVLELNGGAIKTLGIKPGDRVVSRQIGSAG